MELMYVALLLHKAGKPISEDNVKKVVDAVGISGVEGAQIKAIVAALDGVNIDEELEKASQLSVATAPAAESKKEDKKDEVKEEKKTEQAAAGLGALFG